MVNQDLLEEYSGSIRRLKKQCLDAGLTEDEFRQIYFESLKKLEKGQEIKTAQRFTKAKLIIVGVLFMVLVTYNCKSIYSNIICNVQEYIYPGLKLLRKITIPLISLFPSLTDFYYETCLIQNPFFTVVDMDCWPCSIVNNVREIHDPNPNGQHNAPFVYETEQQTVRIEHLKEMYMRHRDVFDKESPNIVANNKFTFTPQEFFHKQSPAGGKNFFIWQKTSTAGQRPPLRIYYDRSCAACIQQLQRAFTTRFNNMNIARLLRQIIPRPKVVPKFGQSTERFIIIDSSQESIRIPDTECSFSFILSLSGSRVVHLNAAEECKHQCKTLKVELRDSYLLWYNWWYWRPVIQPSLGNSTFIAHIGSYC